MNAWWQNDPDERYWLEITDRSDLGADLYAPKLDDAGKPYWSYNLVTEVGSGDVVFHWHKSLGGVPGIVGWSVATGVLEQTTIVWQARGTAGRRHGPTSAEPAWRMPLVGFAPLSPPVDQAAVRREESVLRAIRERLATDHDGPLYFPFAFSDTRPIRTSQGYLVKFPVAVVDAFEELRTVPQPARLGEPAAPSPISGPSPGDARYYQSDPIVRRAIEMHAVARATAYFTALGYEVRDVGAVESFDLVVTLGDETRHVEVKGSSAVAQSVELTANEVRAANDHQPTDLFIVEEITWWRNPDGTVGTDLGTERVLHEWSPAVGDLTVTRYRYQVPTTW